MTDTSKRLERFSLGGKREMQGQLYCLAHNIETLANHGQLAASSSEPESDQNLFGRSEMSRLDKEEQEILDAFDTGELQ